MSMYDQICRKSNSATYSLTASSATTDEIPYGEFDSGGYIATAVTTAATVSYLVAEAPGGTYRPLYDNAGTPVAKLQTIAVGRAFAFPTEARGFGAIRMVVDAGTATVIVTRKG